MSVAPHDRREAPRLASRRAAVRASLSIVLLFAGCASADWVTVRTVPRSPLVDRFQLTSWSGPKPSDRTVQLLRRYDLEQLQEDKPLEVLERLQTLIKQEPSPDKVYSFAELAFLEGKRLEPRDRPAALDLYEAAVTSASEYLFDRRWAGGMNPYDPQFRGACDLYNGALESSLRIVQKEGKLVPGTAHMVKSATRTCEVTIAPMNPRWHAEDFERFEFVSDYEIKGLTNQYQSFGLGVPLIAVHKKHEGEDAAEKYLPKGLSFPVTAFLRLMPTADGAPNNQHRKARLELYDPLETIDVVVNDLRAPLEADLTTPLAYFLNNGEGGSKLATFGLFRPDKTEQLAGLYMTQPYEPDKIPVLFVHGLWSDPTTWTDMFNDLRSTPDVRQNYQFWFYLYPTGQPFWVSAAKMRQDLAQVRTALDPERREPSLDQMVLVGHSMGGLVSKLQTVPSGDDFWKTASKQPFQLVKASSETRQSLEATYYFGPNPSIRRVVTIGTPHRGSDFANKYVRYLGRKFIFLPEMMVRSSKELFRENPDFFQSGSAVDVKTSIDSLAPNSPILPVLLQSQRPAWVKYHNVVGVEQRSPSEPVRPGDGDGIVSYASAHLDNVDSELRVQANHLNVHRHPLTVLEVRRILLEHLAELRSFPVNPQRPGQSPFQLIGAQAGPVPPPPAMKSPASNIPPPPLPE